MDKAKKAQIITVFAVLFLFVLIISLVANIMEAATLSAKKARLEQQLAQINSQIEQNDKEIAYKNSDYYIEQYARENLNMKDDGEDIFSQ